MMSRAPAPSFARRTRTRPTLARAIADAPSPVFACLGIFLLGSGLIALLIFGVFAFEEWQFANRSQLYMATVLGKEVRRAGRAAATSRDYYVRYRFTAEDGRPHEDQDRVRRETWEGIETGQSIQVKYASGWNLSRVAGEGEHIWPFLLASLGLLVALGGARLTARGFRHGSVVPGAFTSHDPEPTSIPVPDIDERDPMRHPDEVRGSHRWLQGKLGTTLWFVFAFAVIIVGQQAPALVAFDALMTPYWPIVIPIAIALMAVGAALFLGTAIYMDVSRGEPMAHEEVEQLASRKFFGYAQSWATYRIWGRTWGLKAEEQSSFAPLKQAWRSGEWWRDARWRIFFLMAGGAALILIGALALIVVALPPGIKLLFVGMFVYAVIRLARAFARA